MAGFLLEKVHLREVLLQYFHMKETSVKSLRILVDIYGEDRETNTDTVIELDLYKKTDLFRDFVVN